MFSVSFPLPWAAGQVLSNNSDVLESAASSAPRVSAECSRLHPTDAVLLIDMQNCFMEERAVRTDQEPSYPLEQNETIEAGPLQVSDSTGIIDVANEWMRHASDAGAKVLITLDWHPELHCSFCNIEQGGVSAPYFCYSGSVIVHAYNESLRCVDAVSQRDWDYQQVTRRTPSPPLARHS